MNELATQSTLALRRWLGLGTGGVDARSRYVDHYWMPLLGPSAVCLARTLMRMVGRQGTDVTLDLDHLGAVLGLDDDHVLQDAFEILDGAGIVAFDGPGVVLVRADFPYLTAAQVDALPEGLAVAHGVPGSLLAAANLDAPTGRTHAPGPHARALSLAATLDEILVNPSLDPGQLAHRWQHVIRLAEEARDDAVLDWAPGDLEATLAESHLAGQEVTEALWSAQQAIVSRRHLGAESRAALAEAAAGIVDWLVAEFPMDDADGDEPEPPFPADW